MKHISAALQMESMIPEQMRKDARVGGGLVVGAGIASLDRRREEARCGEGLFVVSGIASLARH